jgi:ABC-2 type transport system permease protein
MSYLRVVSTEFLKLRRTRITWVLGLLYAIGPLMLGLMMVVLNNPELGQRLGLVTAKAQLTIGSADWPTYLMIVGFLFVGGMIVMGIEQAFVFGREYAEGTAKNMLTLPLGRGVFVAAKLTVTAVWFIIMAALVYGEAIVIGLLIGLPGFQADMLAANAVQAARLCLQVLLLSSVPAWIAVATRGYLAPLGLSILFLLVGDLFAHTGWGPWFPWAIPLMSAGAAGPDAPVPGAGSLLVLVLTFTAGAVAAWATMDRVDNTQ